jgi:hypothetical protein
MEAVSTSETLVKLYYIVAQHSRRWPHFDTEVSDMMKNAFEETVRLFLEGAQ